MTRTRIVTGAVSASILCEPSSLRAVGSIVVCRAKHEGIEDIVLCKFGPVPDASHQSPGTPLPGHLLPPKAHHHIHIVKMPTEAQAHTQVSRLCSPPCNPQCHLFLRPLPGRVHRWCQKEGNEHTWEMSGQGCQSCVQDAFTAKRKDDKAVLLGGRDCISKPEYSVHLSPSDLLLPCGVLSKRAFVAQDRVNAIGSHL